MSALATESELTWAVVRVARLASIDSPPWAGSSSWLSASERERLSRLRVALRHQQFLAGHWLLRQMLAVRLGGSARDYSMHQNPGQPPQLEVKWRCALNLPVSHSGDWIACAVSAGGIGIDLEQWPRQHSLASVAHLLRAADDGAAPLDENALLRRWVAKEAQIKRGGDAALPEQLAALQLHSCAAHAANVLVWTSPAYHLAVAHDAAACIEINSEDASPLQRREAWRVNTSCG